MKFLNGFKTVIGLAGTVAAVVAPRFAPAINEAAPHAIAVAQGVFGLLLALGLIHKAEKASSK
jgi:hypothetical protein